MVDNYFTVDELEPIKKDIEALVDFLATRLHEEGKLQSWYIAAILSTIGCISYSVLLADHTHFKLCPKFNQLYTYCWSKMCAEISASCLCFCIMHSSREMLSDIVFQKFLRKS